MFESIEGVRKRLAEQEYVCDRAVRSVDQLAGAAEELVRTRV